MLSLPWSLSRTVVSSRGRATPRGPSPAPAWCGSVLHPDSIAGFRTQAGLKGCPAPGPGMCLSAPKRGSERVPGIGQACMAWTAPKAMSARTRRRGRLKRRADPSRVLHGTPFQEEATASAGGPVLLWKGKAASLYACAGPPGQARSSMQFCMFSSCTRPSWL